MTELRPVQLHRLRVLRLRRTDLSGRVWYIPICIYHKPQQHHRHPQHYFFSIPLHILRLTHPSWRASFILVKFHICFGEIWSVDDQYHSSVLEC